MAAFSSTSKQLEPPIKTEHRMRFSDRENECGSFGKVIT